MGSHKPLDSNCHLLVCLWGGIRARSHVDGVPYIEWMLAGIVVWFFVY
jgi:ABC-type polysaccharide/polyol phosphate export permease